jgi:hypothetical protein
MSPDQQQIIQLKLNILECYQAEAQLADFLTKCTERYGSVLTLEETLEGNRLANKVAELIRKIGPPDASYHPKGSDDKLPEPQLGCC